VQAAVANEPARDELGCSINGNPCPGVADALGFFKLLWDVSLLAVGETPYLIQLDDLAGELLHDLVVVTGASLANIGHDTGDTLAGKARQPDGGAQRAAFNEAGHDAGAFCDV